MSVIVVISVAVLAVVVVVYKDDEVLNTMENIPSNEKCSAQLSSCMSKNENL